MRRAHLSNGLLAAVLLAGPWTLEAAEPASGTPEWRALKRRIARDKMRARFMLDEERSILQGLRKLEVDQARKRAEVAALEGRLEDLAESRARLEEQRAEAKTRLTALRRRAGRRAAGMVRLRQTSIAALVAAARLGGRLEARRLQDRFRFALRHDRDLLDSAREASAQIGEAEARLESERVEIMETQVELSKSVEASELLEIERQALLEAIRAERRTTERLVRELRSARRQLESEMGKIRGLTPPPAPARGGLGAQKGRLPWPVAGRVEVTFGRRVDPSSDVVLPSQGLDIRAGQSEPVRAIFDGRVAYSSNLDGYGRTVIVAHDDGWFSLYAHLESSLVATGVRVRQYQVVGFVGDTGTTKGSHLHFQLRRGRDPIDPIPWLAP